MRLLTLVLDSSDYIVSYGAAPAVNWFNQAIGVRFQRPKDTCSKLPPKIRHLYGGVIRTEMEDDHPASYSSIFVVQYIKSVKIE